METFNEIAPCYIAETGKSNIFLVYVERKKSTVERFYIVVEGFELNRLMYFILTAASINV